MFQVSSADRPKSRRVHGPSDETALLAGKDRPLGGADENPQAGRCLLCGSGSGRIVLRENGYVGRGCQCGVVYIDPSPQLGLRDLLHDHHVESYYSLPAKTRLAFVRRMRPSGKLLEVGCGPGNFLEKARAAGYDVCGMEPNPASAQKAMERGIPVEMSLIEETDSKGEQFDIVFHVDLLSHFPDPVRALKSMVRLTKPGGLLCFEVGLFGGLSRFAYRWIGRVGYPQHLWLYSYDALAATLDKAGLEIVQAKRFGLLPGTIVSTVGNAFSTRLLPKPVDSTGKSATPNKFYRLYGWLQYFLRYRIGAIVPCVGPACAFVAVRRKAESSATSPPSS